uniref:EGF-like domain-containing protein n=1 Tax=Ditylenchus dipsaci TaxID=166011 RepID=A0A915E4I8_9BILA
MLFVLTHQGIHLQVPKFYSGDHCEIVGICARDPCLNQGECLQESPSQHTCKCPKGYRGNLCEEQINYCLQEPCHNGATCIPRLAGFECLCIAGFTGTTCETDIDDCAAESMGLSAIVGHWMEGPQCLEDINECADPASNCLHGQCANLPGDYQCKCHNGFIGKKCNMVNPCIPNVHNRTLHNCAHGRCVNPVVIRQYSGREVTQHDCECHKGYAGPMCTVLVQPSRSIALGFILGPITVVLIVLCVFGTMLFLFVARKKRANQGTYSPSTQEMTGAARVQVRDSKKFREGYQGNY